MVVRVAGPEKAERGDGCIPVHSPTMRVAHGTINAAAQTWASHRFLRYFNPKQALGRAEVTRVPLLQDELVSSSNRPDRSRLANLARSGRLPVVFPPGVGSDGPSNSTT
nr:hypothetical protein CFP56_30120 [Quercus suber]